MAVEDVETVLIEMARLAGHSLNGQERLIIRTRVATSLAAKERHKRRMEAKPYKWTKPVMPRR
jgi:hypothetical protein